MSAILLYQPYFSLSRSLIEKVATEDSEQHDSYEYYTQNKLQKARWLLKAVESVIKVGIFFCWDNLHIVFKSQKHTKLQR